MYILLYTYAPFICHTYSYFNIFASKISFPSSAGIYVGRQHVVWGGFAHPNLKGSRAAFHSVVFHFNKAVWGAQPTNMVPLLVCVFDMRVG